MRWRELRFMTYFGAPLRQIVRLSSLRFLAFSAALVCALASGVSASCGSTTSEKRASGHVLEDRDIERYSSGSPQRALLLWFQAVQFDDQPAVRSLTTRRELKRVASKTVDFAVSLVGTSIGTPEIVSVRKTGTRAAVRTLVRKNQPSGHAPVQTAHTFYLTRVGPGWKVDDVSYLIHESDAVLARRH